MLNDPHGRVAQQAHQLRPADIFQSAIVGHELNYGAFKSQRREQNLALVDALQFEVVPFDQDDARHAGEIRAAMAGSGMPIGPYDVLIAGQARSRGLVLVSRNLREFHRVKDLKVENWEA